ncbi:MAG TPA: transcriptional repressor [Candidatus Binatia bacterium]
MSAIGGRVVEARPQSVTEARPQPVTRQRATRQLDATLRVLSASREHPTAEEVYRAVCRELPGVGRGTVYRNLQKLLAAGRARLVHVHDRAARYDARLDPHDHFVCTRCAMVIDVERGREAEPPTRTRVAGHRVEGRTVTYFGACNACEGNVVQMRRHRARERRD